jgi:hypothetical protein
LSRLAASRLLSCGSGVKPTTLQQQQQQRLSASSTDYMPICNQLQD